MVKFKTFIRGDLVLQKVIGSARNPSWGKLGPNQEGPYQVTSVAGVGAYRLEDLDGLVVPRPWNVNNLQKYYFQFYSLVRNHILYAVSCIFMTLVVFLRLFFYVKQNPDQVRFLGSPALSKLTLRLFFMLNRTLARFDSSNHLPWVN